MKTLSLNVEIKDEDKENGKLKDKFKFNVEVNFMKTILDYIKKGNDITINKLIYSERIMNFKTNVEVIDPDTKEKKILKDIIKKNVYNCSCIVTSHKYVKLESNKSRDYLIPAMKKGERLRR
jgi:DNA-dependent RNA polymerase auxiliary subunit epsilon